MSFNYKRIEKLNKEQATNSSTNAVLIGPVDIRNFDKFSIFFENLNTGIAFLDMVVQVAADSSDTAANLPPRWVNLSTATLQVPSALGATAVAVGGPVDNAYGFLRVLGKTNTTASVNTFRIEISGFERF